MIARIYKTLHGNKIIINLLHVRDVIIKKKENPGIEYLLVDNGAKQDVALDMKSISLEEFCEHINEAFESIDKSNVSEFLLDKQKLDLDVE